MTTATDRSGGIEGGDRGMAGTLRHVAIQPLVAGTELPKTICHDIHRRYRPDHRRRRPRPLVRNRQPWPAGPPLGAPAPLTLHRAPMRGAAPVTFAGAPVGAPARRTLAVTVVVLR